MAETDLKVTLIPDTRKLDRALKGKRIGGGNGKGSKEDIKQTKNSGMMLGVSKKMLGKMGIIGAVLTGLDFIIRPVMAILKAILTLLFLPLLPILKPALKILAASLPIMVQISKGLTKIVQFVVDNIKEGFTTIVSWVTKLFNIFKAFVKGIATLGLWVWEEIIKPGFEPLLDVGERIWTEILKPGFDFLKNALISIADALIIAINKLPFIDIPLPSSKGVITTPSVHLPPNQSFPTQTISPTVNIHNPIIRETSDIKKIADAVSKVLGGQVLRGGVLSLI